MRKDYLSSLKQYELKNTPIPSRKTQKKNYFKYFEQKEKSNKKRWEDKQNENPNVQLKRSRASNPSHSQLLSQGKQDAVVINLDIEAISPIERTENTICIESQGKGRYQSPNNLLYDKCLNKLQFLSKIKLECVKTERDNAEKMDEVNQQCSTYYDSLVQKIIEMKQETLHTINQAYQDNHIKINKKQAQIDQFLLKISHIKLDLQHSMSKIEQSQAQWVQSCIPTTMELKFIELHIDSSTLTFIDNKLQEFHLQNLNKHLEQPQSRVDIPTRDFKCQQQSQSNDLFCSQILLESISVPHLNISFQKHAAEVIKCGQPLIEADSFEQAEISPFFKCF